MNRLWWLAVAPMFLTSTARAQSSVRFSTGYALAHYLEEGGGTAPFGLYVAAQGTSEIAFKGEIAYHRDEFEFFSGDITLHTITAFVGPCLNGDATSAQPFFHLLVGGREDIVEGDNNWAMGGEVGAGVDAPIGSKSFIRIGADFQIFTDDGETVKMFRLTLGLAFM